MKTYSKKGNDWTIARWTKRLPLQSGEHFDRRKAENFSSGTAATIQRIVLNVAILLGERWPVCLPAYLPSYSWMHFHVITGSPRRPCVQLWTSSEQGRLSLISPWLPLSILRIFLCLFMSFCFRSDFFFNWFCLPFFDFLFFFLILYFFSCLLHFCLSLPFHIYSSNFFYLYISFFLLSFSKTLLFFCLF